MNTNALYKKNYMYTHLPVTWKNKAGRWCGGGGGTSTSGRTEAWDAQHFFFLHQDFIIGWKRNTIPTFGCPRMRTNRQNRDERFSTRWQDWRKAHHRFSRKQVEKRTPSGLRGWLPHCNVCTVNTKSIVFRSQHKEWKLSTRVPEPQVLAIMNWICSQSNYSTWV